MTDDLRKLAEAATVAKENGDEWVAIHPDTLLALTARVAELEAALRLPDADRRQWYLSELIATKGYFNRKDLCEHFKISTPQASADIRRFTSEFPELTTYNKSLKRYDLRRAATAAMEGK